MHYYMTVLDNGIHVHLEELLEARAQGLVFVVVAAPPLKRQTHEHVEELGALQGTLQGRNTVARGRSLEHQLDLCSR